MEKQIRDLRAKYMKNGYSSLSDLEKIKILLSYSEKDIENIEKSAKKILSNYNNIQSEITASILFLTNKYDINLRSAILLKLITRIIKIRKLNQLHLCSDYLKNVKLNSISNSKNFFYTLLHDSYIEKFVVVAVTNNLKIINYSIVSSNDIDKIKLSNKKIYQFARLNKSEHIFFAHSHPHGSSSPSDNDIYTTIKIRNELNSLNVNIIDHIIVGKHNATSLYEILRNNKFDGFYNKEITTVLS